MRSKLIQSEFPRVFVVVFNPGEEVSDGLRQFASEHDLGGASFTGVGAFSRVTLGFFDLDKKDYEKIEIEEQVEVLVLAGNIARYKGQPKVHTHVVIGKRDGTAMGGHLLEAHVRPTLEVTITEAGESLVRETDEETGLALLRP